MRYLHYLLLSNSVNNVQAQLDRISQVAAEMGLIIINVKKTKVFAVDISDRSPRAFLNNNKIEVVTDFQYFVSYIASSEHDMKCCQERRLESPSMASTKCMVIYHPIADENQNLQGVGFPHG